MFEKLRRTSLYLFVFSLCFEYWDPFGIRSYFSVTKMAGIIYFLFSILTFSHTSKFVLNLTKKVSWFFFIILFSSIFYFPIDGSLIFNFSLFQCLILFLLLTKELNNEAIRNNAIHYFIYGICLLSILSMNGIGLSVEGGRLKTFGTNSNSLGNFGAIAFILAFGFIFNLKNKLYSVLSLLGSLPFSLYLVSQSGSRGALICVLIGMTSIILLKKGKFFYKFLSVIVGVFIITLTVEYIMEDEMMSKRMEMTLEEGDTGGRFDIWNDAFSIFIDHPVMGVGEPGYKEEMISRYSYYKDTHNMFLYILVTTGIIGLSIYLSLLLKIAKIVVQHRYTTNNSTYISLFLSIIFLMTKSGGFLTSKFLWFILSILTSLSIYLYLEIKANEKDTRSAKNHVARNHAQSD